MTRKEELEQFVKTLTKEEIQYLFLLVMGEALKDLKAKIE